jgi:putative membrane protein insertion efficiency factor
MKNSSITLAKRSIEPGRAESSLAGRALLKVIALYQRITAGRVSACRFYPSCSSYALEAIELHGAGRGSALALRRLARCRPFGPHGVDLVPQSPHTRSTPR